MCDATATGRNAGAVPHNYMLQPTGATNRWVVYQRQVS
jgi:hypothetical protein